MHPGALQALQYARLELHDKPKGSLSNPLELRLFT
jgi:hypothetical protein